MVKDDFSKIPNGAPGVEERIKLLYTYGVANKRISFNKFVEVTSTNAAKIFGLYPRKGEIQVGSDADLVVLDTNKEKVITNSTLRHNVDYTLYEGFKVSCQIRDVFLRGEHVVEDREIKKVYRGKYLKSKIKL